MLLPATKRREANRNRMYELKPFLRRNLNRQSELKSFLRETSWGRLKLYVWIQASVIPISRYRILHSLMSPDVMTSLVVYLRKFF